MIEKSGVGRAIYHQKKAAAENNITCVDKLKDADVVHINTVFLRSCFVARRAHRLHIPVVFHAHSTKEDFKNSYIGSNLLDKAFGVWIKHCYNLGDIIVTPSEYSKKLLRSYGITKEIQVVSNGIDLNYYKADEDSRERFRKKYGFSEKDRIIMSVGLMIDRKGILDFVELAKRMPNYQFIWFGESNLSTVPAKVRKAVQTKLPNLHFPGYIGKAELKDAYSGCDLFLFPSKEETEGIVVLEAMAMKIPVLVRNIPVYEGWVNNREQAYMADSVEEFELLARNILNGYVEDLTKNAYRVVQERSIDLVGGKLRNIYQQEINEYCYAPSVRLIKYMP